MVLLKTQETAQEKTKTADPDTYWDLMNFDTLSTPLNLSSGILNLDTLLSFWYFEFQNQFLALDDKTFWKLENVLKTQELV